jgi:hypothetical protein
MYAPIIVNSMSYGDDNFLVAMICNSVHQLSKGYENIGASARVKKTLGKKPSALR